ncbi:glucans biosynthesis glucosyltransferase MdoH [Leptospira ellisii]|uniref:Glucans biosynthesis glucosyltransferase H n=1 Tax=Leptospira ellisii TaxID=2023197 RepID=A0A2N0BN96_9LEPT|nr:glucans biosynthesis glucosyltransferase MdoH [Leptospira ellisii]MDV6234669.1 glucans biosynthesis glucosyltransferase MdoH [Leptospira ellisii]PJZ91105.1 glucan biosynthesis glucosyltransferase H [Leptospira ellisii]PKA05461.1 glucan biosynthesis glucosyltransferase H [Leptospira ellisii]
MSRETVTGGAYLVDSKNLTYRRLSFGGLVFFFVIIGVFLEVQFLSFQSISPFEWATLILFCALFPIICFGAAISIFGFIQKLRGGDPLRISKILEKNDIIKDIPPVAVVMPVHCEDVARIFAGAECMLRGIADNGLEKNTDFFILSDTSDPNLWALEEKAFSVLSAKPGNKGRVYYRKRRLNLNKKSGNIADFCRRWGKRYKYMIILDADSVMTGECMKNLIYLMEKIPDAGIIQTAPEVIEAKSLFQKLSAFGAWAGSGVFGAGSFFWQLMSGPFWGHNAIVRLQPFMKYCGLPGLPGESAIGGKILSHDTIEAALFRKAGYSVWFAADLKGSYEEAPPNVLEALKRDNRWCQGNLQHFWFLFGGGLRFSSRLQILLGIFSYFSSPLWALLLISSSLTTIEDVDFFRLALLPEDWAAFRDDLYLPIAYTLQGYTLFVLFLPRIVSFLEVSLFRRKEWGGSFFSWTVSFFLEFIHSVFTAPVYMVQYSRFILLTFLNRKIEWGPQNRDADSGPDFRALAYTLLPACFYGLGLGIWMFVSYPILFFWFLPLLAGWIFSYPIALWTSKPTKRKAVLGILNNPPELREVGLLERLNRFRADYSEVVGNPGSYRGIFLTIADPVLNEFHRSRLRKRNRETPGRRKYLSELRTSFRKKGPFSLSSKELFRILWDYDSVEELHVWLWTNDLKTSSIWWKDSFLAYQREILSNKIVLPAEV